MSALQQYMQQSVQVGGELSAEAGGEFQSRREEYSLENAYDDLQTQQKSVQGGFAQDIGFASEGGAKALHYSRKLYKTFANNETAQKYGSKMADSLLGEENSKALQSAIKGGSEALNAYKGGNVQDLIKGLKSGDTDALSTIKGLLPEGSDLAKGLEAGEKGATEGVSQLLGSMTTSGGKIVSGAKQAIQNAQDTGTGVAQDLSGKARSVVSDLSGQAQEVDIFGKPLAELKPPTLPTIDSNLPEEAGWKDGVFRGVDKPSVSAPVSAKSAVPEQPAPSSDSIRAIPENNPYSLAQADQQASSENMGKIFPKQETSNVDFSRPAPVIEPKETELPDIADLQIAPKAIEQGRIAPEGAGGGTQEARDALAKAMGQDRNAGGGGGGEIKWDELDTPEATAELGLDRMAIDTTKSMGSVGNPFQADQARAMGYRPPPAKPAEVPSEITPAPAEAPTSAPTSAPTLEPKPTTTSAELQGADTSDLGDVLGRVGGKLGGEVLDEGVGIGTKLLGLGGSFLDALGPIGDLAMMGSMAYSAFTEKDEGALMLAQGDKIHSQMMTMGQGASISEGSLAGATLNTRPQSIGATFPHF